MGLILRDAMRFNSKVKPHHAEGKFKIDLLDPITGKIKNRIEEKNHVFADSLFSGEDFDWIDTTSEAWLELTDSDAAIDEDLPFIMGQTVGYGRPGYSGSGLYRGAYSSANQILASITSDSVRWKFQYDFTTAQANGTIKTIGLTHQHNSYRKGLINGFRGPIYNKTTYSTNTCDGRYSYKCSTAGIITKYDNWFNAETTIDVSSAVGTTSSDRKTVGYNPSSGKYYVWVSSSTAANRKMYVFSDGDFGTLENTHSPSSITMNSDSYPMYVYGNYIYRCEGKYIYKADFVNNVDYDSISIQGLHSYAGITEGYGNSTDWLRSQYGTCAFGGTYIYLSNSAGASPSQPAHVFDMSTDSVVCLLTCAQSGEKNPAYLHPLATNDLPSQTYYTTVPINNCAIAAKKLSSAVTKTSSYGMTATYELEVFW